MQLKDGVRINGIKAETILALVIAKGIYAKYGDSFVVTSVSDGEHMEGSLHYVGHAFDCRLPAASTVKNILKELTQALGGDFDVVLETNHLHVEYQPKESYEHGSAEPDGDPSSTVESG